MQVVIVILDVFIVALLHDKMYSCILESLLLHDECCIFAICTRVAVALYCNAKIFFYLDARRSR